MFAIAVSTIDEGHVLAANPYFLRTVEYSEEELIGQGTVHLGLWADPAHRDRRARNVMRDKLELNELVAVRTKSGKIKHFLVSSQYVMIGNKECVVGTGTDITHQIESERRLEEANRRLMDSKHVLSIAKAAAERASMAKGAFLANMSHEIRTPLSIIQGFTEILLESQWPPKQLQYLQRIHSSVHYLRELIDRVLDMSKIEAQEDAIEPTRFILGEKIAPALDALSEQARGKNIQFISSIDEVKDLLLFTDHVRLMQIITNLCSNAIKFTQEGHVELTGRREIANGQSHLVLQITDTGIGIAAEHREQLFKIFSQVHTQADFGGAGLGLYLSRQLALKLGGDVKLIRSTPGVGSVFEARVLTDLREITPTTYSKEKSGPAANNIKLRGLRILAAEDNESMRMIIKGMVNLLGGTVEIVENGLELLARAEQFAPDLVLLDNRMPKLGGLETAAILRQKGYQGKIIALTASAFEQERRELLDAGCDDVLTKPFNMASFTTVLKRQMPRLSLSL